MASLYAGSSDPDALYDPAARSSGLGFWESSAKRWEPAVSLSLERTGFPGRSCHALPCWSLR